MKKLILYLINKSKLNHIINDFKNIFITPKLVYQEMDYNKYWNNREANNYFQYRFPLIVNEVDNNSSVLDIGCGDGAFLFYLKERRTLITELGVDISETGIMRAKEKGINATVRAIETFDSKIQKYDYVVMSEVIEHVPNAEYFVQKGFELANKKLIITIPNTGYYTYRIRLLFGSFPIQWVHHPAEHLRFWTITDFKRWLNSLNLSGFNGRIKVIPSNGLPYLKIYSWYPSLFCKQVIYVIEKS
jgi:methionine biosynthesis protein MetW